MRTGGGSGVLSFCSLRGCSSATCTSPCLSLKLHGCARGGGICPQGGKKMSPQSALCQIRWPSSSAVVVFKDGRLRLPPPEAPWRTQQAAEQEDMKDIKAPRYHLQCYYITKTDYTAHSSAAGQRLRERTGLSFRWGLKLGAIIRPSELPCSPPPAQRLPGASQVEFSRRSHPSPSLSTGAF